jgi:hypothetical protein
MGHGKKSARRKKTPEIKEPRLSMLEKISAVFNLLPV